MNDEFQGLRELMVLEQIANRGVRDKSVLDVMKKVPRHLFLPDYHIQEAYFDYPISIGYGQTISQPYIVALMTELLEIKNNDRILEIGTGSGYQTAILASLSKEVYSIERIQELSEKSQLILKSLGYSNIHFLKGNGFEGWKEFAPFDGIIVTAAPEIIPDAYIEQLEEGGRLVIPVGGIFDQSLKIITKGKGMNFQEQKIIDVRFVKLINE